MDKGIKLSRWDVDSWWQTRWVREARVGWGFEVLGLSEAARGNSAEAAMITHGSQAWRDEPSWEGKLLRW